MFTMNEIIHIGYFYASYNSLIHYFIAQKRSVAASSTHDVDLVQLYKTWTNYLLIKKNFLEQTNALHVLLIRKFVH